MRRWFRQLQLLLWKNIRLQLRDVRGTLLTFLAPLLFIFILWIGQKSLESRDLYGDFFKNIEVPVEEVSGKLPRCIPWTNTTCYSIAYVPAGDLFAKSIIDSVAEDNDIPPEEIISFASAEALDEFLFQNPNVTQVAVVFGNKSTGVNGNPDPTEPFGANFSDFLPCATSLTGLRAVATTYLAPEVSWNFIRGDFGSGGFCGTDFLNVTFDTGSGCPTYFPIPLGPNVTICLGADIDVTAFAQLFAGGSRCPPCGSNPLCLDICYFCYPSTVCYADYDKMAPWSALPSSDIWEYYIQRNSTLTVSHGKSIEYMEYIVVPLATSVEKAMLQKAFELNGKTLDRSAYNVTHRDFPHKEYLTVNIIGGQGPTWFFAAIMFNFVTGVSMITTEKEFKLRAIMKTMGLYDSAYWVSWFITLGTMNTITIFVLIIAGCMFQFDFFLKNAFGLYFFALWLFALSIVPLAFLLSVIINRASDAVKAGFFIFVLGLIILAVASSVYVEDQEPAVVIVLNLLSPGPVALALSLLGTATASADSPGLSWSQRDLQYNNLLSFNQIFAWLIGDMLIYLTIALYIDNVKPTEYGTKKAPWYFLLPSYWMGKSTAKPNLEPIGPPHKNIDTDVRQERKAVAKGDLPQETAVVIRNLSKRFKPGTGCRKTQAQTQLAVDDLCLSIEQDTLFCLLGPNGAGKTTTIHMLSGFMEPTRGDAEVFGHSVVGELATVQEGMGFCPQFDILWPDLSGEEHLRLFAGLRGLAAEELTQEVTRLLQEVDLEASARQKASYYSGGMRRRLSVAVALIGDPKIVFLDEPTTGMDPVSRRAVWNIIERAKKGRVLVLTTHSMEEADILGDRIAIMADGRLQCLGSGLHLKQKFGAGYRISVGHSCEGKPKKLIKYFSANLPGVKHEVRGDTVEFEVPREAVPDLPDLFEHFDSNMDKLSATSIQLNLTTLEEVFLNVAGSASAALAELATTKRTAKRLDDEEEPQKMTKELKKAKKKNKTMKEHKIPPARPLEESFKEMREWMEEHPPAERKTTRNQLNGLFRKDFALWMTHKKLLVCQLFTPVYFCLLIYLFAFLINDLAIDASDVAAQPYGKFSSAFNLISLPYNESNDLFGAANVSETFEDVFNSSAFQDLLSSGTTVLCLNSADDSVYPGRWNNLSSLESSGLLGRLSLQPTPHVFSIFVVFGFDANSSLALGATPLQVKFEEVLDEATLFRTWYDAHRDGQPRYSSGIDLQLADYTNNQFRAIVYYNNSLGRGEDIPFLLNRVANSVSMGLPRPISIQLTGVKSFPNLLTPGFRLDVDAVIGPFFFLLVLLIPIPSFLATLAFERETRVREMMAMMGLKTFFYFFVHYVITFVLYFVMMHVLILFGFIFQFRVFTINAFWSYWVTFFIWGHTLIALTLLMSTIINRRSTALVVGYLLVFGSALISNSFVSSQIEAETVDPAGANGLSLIPMFALYRAIEYLGNEVAFQNPGFGDGPGRARLTSPEAPLGVAWAFIAGEFIVLLLVWFYLEQVLPREWGVAKHPLFCFGKKYTDPDHDEDEEIALRVMPEDVKKMKADVTGKKAEDRFPLRSLGLTKVFTKDKVPFTAVKPTYLGVKQNETVSVLGHNGAGKTTLIHMLIGLIGPTAGTAHIHGYDLRSEMEQIHQILGICPQHDILWDTLTALQHLEFYGRIRGLPEQLLQQHAWDLLRAVNLDTAQKKGKIVKQFSGGMKRRLAVAISVLGSPKVIFLDEPSTGLDPKSRQDLWAVIQAAKAHSTLFLTTHSMEEAEEISDRLIIMSDGNIQCVGTATELKDRFGEGLKLSVHINRRKTDRYEGPLRSWVSETFEGSILVNSLAGMLTFILPKVKLGHAFAMMERNKKTFHITDWAITNPTLEEVFLKVIHRNLGEGPEVEYTGSPLAPKKLSSRGQKTNSLALVSDSTLSSTEYSSDGDTSKSSTHS